MIRREDGAKLRYGQVVAERDALAAKAAAEVTKWQNSAIEAQARIRELEAALREVQRQYTTHCEIFLGEEIQERIDALLTPLETEVAK